MAATRTFTANFVGRTSNLEKSFKRVSKGSSLMSDNLMRSTRMAGLGFAALGGVVIGAAAALKPMIDKAAAMEEALSKNQLLLGESSKAVEAFADTSLHSFGVTNLAALQATGVFASLGDAMGMSEEASASMATTLTGLAGDLSSLHDVSVETALTALRAGLIGEAEPLRKLGILLDAATIKSKALTMGLVKNTKEALTPAIKSQAAYALILEKGAAAMGDFARTSDSATNATKTLAGEWEQLQVKIGTAILPFYTAMINHLVDVILPAVNEFWDDPTWTRGAKTASEAAQNAFVKGFAGFTLGLAGAVLSPAGLVFKQLADMAGFDPSDPIGMRQRMFRAGEETGTAMTSGFVAAIGQFGRNNPDWWRGDWDPAASGTADGTAYGAAAALAAAGAMAPGPGFPPFGPVVPPAGPMAPGPGFPAFPVPPAGPIAPGPGFPAFPVPPAGPIAPGPGFPSVPVPPAGPIAPGPGFPAPGPRAPSLPGRGGFTMDPGQRGGGTTVNNHFNITGVSPGEVMDAIGQAVDLTGPMPPHWQQSAG